MKICFIVLTLSLFTRPPYVIIEKISQSSLSFFADDLALTYKRPTTKIPNSIINYLYSYEWPGNIRELRNVIEYMYVMQGDTADFNLSHLPPYLVENNTY
ncbi:AAA-type ATPase lid domain-containing protein [Shigella sp. FC1967]